jgi:hypothetical protein
VPERSPRRPRNALPPLPAPVTSADVATGQVAALAVTPSPSPDGVPVLAEDESPTVKTPGSDVLDQPATEAGVTFTGLEQADRLPLGLDEPRRDR